MEYCSFCCSPSFKSGLILWSARKLRPLSKDCVSPGPALNKHRGQGSRFKVIFTVPHSNRQACIHVFFYKGPVWVSTGLKSFLGVLMFLLFSFSLGRSTLRTMVSSSDDSQFVFKWMMWVEKQVLVCMCGFPVNLSIKTSVLFGTVQKGILWSLHPP